MLTKKKCFLVLLITVMVAATLLSRCRNDTIRIKYYYNSYCPSCRDDVAFYDMLSDQASDILWERNYTIKVVNITEDGLKEFYKSCKSADLPEDSWLTPILFINDNALVGEQSIRENLRDNVIGAFKAIGHFDLTFTSPVPTPLAP